MAPDGYAHYFFFIPVLLIEIESEIISWPMYKAHGLYSCPTRVLICAKHVISRPLAEIMNYSIQMGIYPSKLKYAKVIPIYKGDDETDPGNYRPISLLSVFNRIFEKLMYKRLKLFFDENVLYKSQFGFREKNISFPCAIGLLIMMLLDYLFFPDNFQLTLDKIRQLSKKYDIVILGDFSAHFNSSSQSDCTDTGIQLYSFLECNGLTQLISEPTRTTQHHASILD